MGLYFIVLVFFQFIFDYFVGIGVLVMGFGFIVFVFFQFIFGLYIFIGDDVTYCDIGVNVIVCIYKDSFFNYKYVFFFGQFFYGVGVVFFYIFGVTYLDENLFVCLFFMYIGKYYD